MKISSIRRCSRKVYLTCILQEKQKKLWHTPFYDSEIQLKRLYIKICKNLPGYGCKLYHVKELLKGNTQKKVYLKIISVVMKCKTIAFTYIIVDTNKERDIT